MLFYLSFFFLVLPLEQTIIHGAIIPSLNVGNTHRPTTTTVTAAAEPSAAAATATAALNITVTTVRRCYNHRFR